MTMSLNSLFRQQVARFSNHPALLASNREPMSYSDLMQQIVTTATQLNGAGLKRGSRVAIVLPNSAEMAAIFLAVSSSMTAAPLNPNYQSSEYEFYLSDIEADALIILQGMDSPARAVAQQHDIPVIELMPQFKAGSFTLDVPRNTIAQKSGSSEDTALILHTSGTTSRPKMVLLTQANLCASAANIAHALALTEHDRCLNIMPLFHIHGLMAAVLAPLMSGGSVWCTSGFNSPLFFEWLTLAQPTWYTAVPTMHQAILGRAEANLTAIAETPLRFIRSSSASLPPIIMAELERIFNAPIIEAYGMTEAAHQIASNPMPPRSRKPGSVGVAAGPQVAIMDTAGNMLPTGNIGEIVLRGENVTSGYANNPSANESAFTRGWFRTGDQGHLDEEGYLFITGRIKELINRGGEKIAPLEVDEVLLRHPDVAQAVTFGMPHSVLGEDVAAALVFKPGATATPAQIREFASRYLAYYKLPHEIVILDDLPKGPTGKLQRIGLAERLGLTATPSDISRPPLVAPTTELEKTIAHVWSTALKVEVIGIYDNFIDLGGDSLLAIQVVARLRDLLQTDLMLVTFLETPTIAEMASKITRLQASSENDLDQLLHDLENMSDEEAARLL